MFRTTKANVAQIPIDKSVAIIIFFKKKRNKTTIREFWNLWNSKKKLPATLHYPSTTIIIKWINKNNEIEQKREWPDGQARRGGLLRIRCASTMAVSIVRRACCWVRLSVFFFSNRIRNVMKNIAVLTLDRVQYRLCVTAKSRALRSQSKTINWIKTIERQLFCTVQYRHTNMNLFRWWFRASA